jgi:hypothetical protein
MKHLFSSLVVLAVSISALGAPAYAQSATSYTCEVVEIDAKKAESAHIDASIKDLSKYLTKGPIAVYNHFTKLARKNATLATLQSSSFDLQKGTATVMIREVRQRAGKPDVLTLDIGIDDENGKRWIDAKQNVAVGKFGNYIRSVSDSNGIVYFIGCKA